MNSPKRSFAVPVAVAVAGHALLMFGFTGGKPPAREATTTPRDISEIICIFPEPESAQPAGDDVPGSSHKDKVDVAPPVLPESPVKTDTGDMIVPLKPANPQVNVHIDTIHIGLPTHPGDDDGDGPGGPGNNIRTMWQVLDNEPRTKFQPPPEYPRHCKIDGITGRAEVEFWVDESGRVRDPRIRDATNNDFGEAAVRAVSKWKFFPGTSGGVPVPFKMCVPLIFSLSDE